MAAFQKPAVSVILCTHNPHEAQFEWALTSLESQSVSTDEFEVIVVDNNSAIPLSEDKVRGTRRLNLRVVAEPRLGLTYARCTGILNAQADLLVFLDDDNYLLPEYLEHAIAIAAREPEIGNFGGISLPLYEKPIPNWLEPFVPSLGVRDYGPEPITSRESRWGKWEPIGAGMVCRRSIAEGFIRVVEASDLAQHLGRKGRQLTSGEDSLFARIGVDAGFACSYQPALRLFHFIRADRLRPVYLARMQFWQGRSHVILETLSGRPIENERHWTRLRRLWKHASYRFDQDGFRIGLIAAFWHVGCYFQTNAQLSDEESQVWIRTALTPQPTDQGRRSAQ